MTRIVAGWISMEYPLSKCRINGCGRKREEVIKGKGKEKNKFKQLIWTDTIVEFLNEKTKNKITVLNYEKEGLSKNWNSSSQERGK